MKRILIATSNPGKIRDFSRAAALWGIEIAPVPDLSALPPVVEDGSTFAANARKKAENYSRYAPGEIVIADDSGLEVDALGGAPGVHSARYAAEDTGTAGMNSPDRANNLKLIHAIEGLPEEARKARFVCVIAAARDDQTLRVFEGKAEGIILTQARGSNGFGYDPLFYFPPLEKTFAELRAEDKAKYSHRGQAFRNFLEWYRTFDLPSLSPR